MSTAVIIMTHGSRAPEWRAPFERLQQQLHDTLGPGRIGLAYLEFIPPTLPEEIDRLAADFWGITAKELKAIQEAMN